MRFRADGSPQTDDPIYNLTEFGQVWLNRTLNYN